MTSPRQLFAYVEPRERAFLAAQLGLDEVPGWGVDPAEIARHRAVERAWGGDMERRLVEIAADERTHQRLAAAFARRHDWRSALAGKGTGIGVDTGVGPGDRPPADLNLRVRGRPVSLHCPDTLESYLIVFEVFLAEPYRIDAGVPLIYDLGAHVGVSALYLHAIHPDAEIVCVEPIRENLSFLEENLRRNRIRSRILPAAAAAESGTVTLQACPAMTSLSSTHGADGLPVEPRIVPAIGLREIVRAGPEGYGLKLDVEGAEHALLERPDVLDRAAWVTGEVHLGPRIVRPERARDLLRALERRFPVVEVEGPGTFGDTVTYTVRAMEERVT